MQFRSFFHEKRRRFVLISLSGVSDLDLALLSVLFSF